MNCEVNEVPVKLQVLLFLQILITAKFPFQQTTPQIQITQNYFEFGF
jgi:hypothetical protein